MQRFRFSICDFCFKFWAIAFACWILSDSSISHLPNSELRIVDATKTHLPAWIFNL